MTSHQRQKERYSVTQDVDVYDALRDTYIGRLVNIHSNGLMLIADKSLNEDTLYTFDIHLPLPIRNLNSIQIGVDCLWVRDADLAGKYWMGFSIIDATPESLLIIEQIIKTDL